LGRLVASYVCLGFSSPTIGGLGGVPQYRAKGKVSSAHPDLGNYDTMDFNGPTLWVTVSFARGLKKFEWKLLGFLM